MLVGGRDRSERNWLGFFVTLYSECVMGHGPNSEAIYFFFEKKRLTFENKLDFQRRPS